MQIHKLASLFISVCLFVTLALFLSACQGQTPPAQEATGKTLTIAASFYPIYVATVNIAGDIPGVKVVNLTQPTTGCLHDYHLKPDDLKTLSEAQILVVNGAGMESFLDKAVTQQPDLKIVDASKDIPLIKGEDGDNPHVWVSVSNAIRQVENIRLQLAAIDPDHAAQYSANAAAYIERLEALRAKMHQALDGASKRDIITFHEAFPYFAREFNLNIVAVIEREPGSETSAAELTDTIEIVRRSKIKVLFAEPQYTAKAAETIARETGAKIFILDPVVTGSMEPDAYIKIMESNSKILEEALK